MVQALTLRRFSMNSLQQFNRLTTINELIEYSDQRPPGVIYDNTVAANQVINILEGQSFDFPTGINIIDISNYNSFSLSLVIEFDNVVSGIGLDTGTLPSYMSVNQVGDVYTITGFRTSLDWQVVRNFKVVNASDFFGQYSILSKIISSVNLEKSWTTTVNVEEVTVFGPAVDFEYTSGTVENISAPTFSDEGSNSPVWTVTVTPNFTQAINTFTTTGTGGTFSVDPTTKVITIVGTHTQINSRLQGLRLSSAIYQDWDFTLTYYAVNSGNQETDTKIQKLRSKNFDVLNAVRGDSEFTTGQVSSITNTPQVSDNVPASEWLDLSISPVELENVENISGQSARQQFELLEQFTDSAALATMSASGKRLFLYINNSDIIKVYFYNSNNEWIFEDQFQAPEVVELTGISNSGVNRFKITANKEGTVFVLSNHEFNLDTGRVWIFRRAASGVNPWSESPFVLDNPDNINSEFGYDIAAQGETVLVGTGVTIGTSPQIFHYRWNGSDYQLVQSIFPSISNPKPTLSEIQMSGDGLKLLFAVRNDDGLKAIETYTRFNENQNFAYESIIEYQGFSNFSLSLSGNSLITQRGLDFYYYDYSNGIWIERSKFRYAFINLFTPRLSPDGSYFIVNDVNHTYIIKSLSDSRTVWSNPVEAFKISSQQDSQNYSALSLSQNIVVAENDTFLTRSRVPNFDIDTNAAWYRQVNKIQWSLIDADAYLGISRQLSLTPTPFGVDMVHTMGISDNGRIKVIAFVPRNNPNPTQFPATGTILRIYERITDSTDTWTLRQTITDPRGTSDFGRSGISINLDGSRFAIGDQMNSSIDGPSRVYVYDRSGNQWTLSATIFQPADTYYRFGATTQISNDGEYLLVGSASISGAIVGNNQPSVVWVYQYFNNDWNLVKILENPDPLITLEHPGSYEVSGNAQLTTEQSKFGTASLELDGANGSYVSVPINTRFAFGTDNFTVEMWVYRDSLSGFDSLIDMRTTSTDNALVIGLNGITPYVFVNGSFRIQSGTASLGVWNHIAYVREGTTGQLYLNGQSLGSWTDNTNYSSKPLFIGADLLGNNTLLGFVDEVRIVRGQAIYTANFTPPVSQLPAAQGTVLRLNFGVESEAFGRQVSLDANAEHIAILSEKRSFFYSREGNDFTLRNIFSEGWGEIAMSSNGVTAVATKDVSSGVVEYAPIVLERTVNNWQLSTQLPEYSRMSNFRPRNATTLQIDSTGNIIAVLSDFITQHIVIYQKINSSWIRVNIVQPEDTGTFQGLSDYRVLDTDNYDAFGNCFVLSRNDLRLVVESRDPTFSNYKNYVHNFKLTAAGRRQFDKNTKTFKVESQREGMSLILDQSIELLSNSNDDFEIKYTVETSGPDSSTRNQTVKKV